MNKVVRVAVSVVLALFASHTSVATNKLSDKEIGQRLIGSWIVPSDSTDYDQGNADAIETFRPDGTYTFYEFRDAACQVILRQTQVRWMLENGVLITILPNGSKLRDEVVNIVTGKMTLHSLDDGTTYTRDKALTCSKP
jgi:hypothetical protein